MSRFVPSFLRTLQRLLPVSIAIAGPLLLCGCDQLGIPKPPETTATPAEQVPVVINSPEMNNAPKPSFADATANKSPEELVADFMKKTGQEITDAELQKMATLSPANSAIVSMDLRGAQYTAAGVAALQQLPNLKSLSLVGCPFQGNDWSSISGLTQLESLNLENALLDDQTAAAIGPLVNLKALDLGRTRMTDVGFQHLVKLSKLEEIYCYNMQITGGGFEAFSAKYAKSPLRIVAVSNTQFGSYGFAHLEGKDTLEKIVAGSAGVSDASLTHLRGMKNLKSLLLSGNSISDMGLKVLSSMTDLEELDLGENALVSDFTLGKIRNFKKLRALRVQTTSCTLGGVQELAKLLPDCDIIFQDQKF